MYPPGHSLNKKCNLENLLTNKFNILGRIAVKNPEEISEKLYNLRKMSVKDIKDIYNFDISYAEKPIE